MQTAATHRGVWRSKDHLDGGSSIITVLLVAPAMLGTPTAAVNPAGGIGCVTL